MGRGLGRVLVWVGVCTEEAGPGRVGRGGEKAAELRGAAGVVGALWGGGSSLERAGRTGSVPWVGQAGWALLPSLGPGVASPRLYPRVSLVLLLAPRLPSLPSVF